MGLSGIRWKILVLAVGLSSLVFAQVDNDTSVPPRGKQGRIHIQTNPSQAIAYLGGINLGPTPVDTVVESGRQTLTILLSGEELVHQRVNIWPDSTFTFEKDLVLPYGSIRITTDPQNYDCTVFVDEEEVGTTNGAPLTINNMRIGNRQIKVVYRKKSKEYSLVVIPQKTVELLVNFKGE